MLPTDTDWHADSGNQPITHDWVNAVQLATDSIKAAGSTGTWPAPTGTTLAFGGGKIVIAKNATGIADGLDWAIDYMDYRKRMVVVLAFGGYTAPADGTHLPGEASYSSPGGPGYSVPFDGTNHFWTGAGIADPTADDPRLVICTTGDDAILYCDSTFHYLQMRNETGSTFFPFIVYWVSDQFPTRT